MIRSLFAWLGLLLSCAGIGLFITLGIWIWSVKAEVSRQSEILSDRANKTLDSADRANEVVREIIGKAEYDLAMTRMAATGQVPSPGFNPLLSFTAQKASQDLAGSVERAHNAVVLASEAVVVADAALDVVGGVPELKQMLGVNPEQLDATRTALGNVSSELQQARNFLGVPASSHWVPTSEQLYAVNSALGRARDFTDEVNRVVESTRTRVNETKQSVNVWTARGAVGIGVLSAIGVIGQLFMLHFFWRMLRGRPVS
jgi:hydrogenase maturation protease